MSEKEIFAYSTKLKNQDYRQTTAKHIATYRYHDELVFTNLIIFADRDGRKFFFQCKVNLKKVFFGGVMRDVNTRS
jgi:hypothetical protein